MRRDERWYAHSSAVVEENILGGGTQTFFSTGERSKVVMQSMMAAVQRPNASAPRMQAMNCVMLRLMQRALHHAAFRGHPRRVAFARTLTLVFS